ncbi:MAG: LuxR C-terminal-related transcriptional regulator, partial [Actinomycetota bacterium]|nr:LuxR C-terminal-related transcriptional regulator [Actinomycetota bacterium]
MADTVKRGRLADLTIALSLASDLGTGQPLEHGLRTCLLSLKVAESMGLDGPTCSCVYHVALLRFLGCTSDASEAAVVAGGDDVAFNSVFAPMLNAQPVESLRFFVRHLGEDLPVGRRIALVARALSDPGAGRRSLSAHCEAAARLAGRLGMPDSVRDSLAHAYERWDGKGYPEGLSGEAVPVAIRVVAAARDTELWVREAGWTTAAEVLAHRRGRAYDPAVVDALSADGEQWLAGMGHDLGATVLDAEPAPALTIAEGRIDEALGAVADFADLKSPFLRGHSPGVASLAAAAADAAGLSRDGSIALFRAGMVHDVGRVGVASGTWDRPGALSPEQWERARLHTYFGERVLARCELLAPYGQLAARHHERADGSGYHRGLAGDQLSLPARLLAAADAYRAMVEDRPHRPAHAPADAASLLLGEVDAGRLGRVEVDVLRLIARGLVNKQVAARLGISPKTVGHHIEHIYAKAGVTTRAGAT